LSNFGLDEEFESNFGIRCIGSNKLAHDAKPTGWSVQAWDDR
jgi:hypothetical protein